MIAGERRQVTALFADVVGYTAILEQLGEEKSFPFVQIVYDTLANCVREHDGAVHAFGGDSIMAVFGISEAAEDGALQACRAALAIQVAMARKADDIEARFRVRPLIRVGVSSGVAVIAPVAGEGAALTAIGNTVNLASRIQALAPPGGCLICEPTRRLVEWQVDVEFHAEESIKGVAKPQKLWRLTLVHENARRFDTSVGRGLSPLVGRDENLATMRETLQRSRDGLRAVDLVAEPGLGKTRLVFEFLESLQPEDALIVQGHCAADGQQVPFLPFLEVTRGAFQIRREDNPTTIAHKLETGLRRLEVDTAENLGLLLNLLGLSPPEGSLAGLDGVLIGLRTRDLLPALLKAQCRISTVVLLLEDIHWIDSASEELLANLFESETPSNLLIIHTRRPEYVPPWLGAPCVATHSLAPLDAHDIAHVARTRLGVDRLPDALLRQVTERAEGNPLFSEEILSFLFEQGALRVDSGEVIFDAELGASALPASLLGLLAARTDRLPQADRALLQVAAVIGRRFDSALLSIGGTAAKDVHGVLQRLQDQDIVYRNVDGFSFGFKHVLMRDCVYHSLLSERRSQLHLAIGNALEKRSKGRLAEAAETLAHHYSQTDRKDLAFTYLAMAGAKSLGVFSLEEADRYFGSALALYEADPECASDEQFASLLANYALCLNISLSVKTMNSLAAKAMPVLNRIGDSRDHVLFLHHYVSCLVCNARYLDARRVQQGLSAMAARLGDSEAMAYALVSELSVSTYCAPMSIEAFQLKRLEAEEALAKVDDAYLQNFCLASVGWDEVQRGQVHQAHATTERLLALGAAMNDPRSLGYGLAMKALIASVSDDYEQALEMSERALDVSRANFEQAIASAARCAAIVPLRKAGAVEDVQHHLDGCVRNGWAMFEAGPELMLGIALAMNGNIDAGLRRIEERIARSEQEGYLASADWARLFLCEVYLAILSGEGDSSVQVLIRNIRSLTKVLLLGPSQIVSMIERVRANQQFDRDGHHIGRAEMILGLLYKIRRKNVLAVRHLTEARRVIGAAGSSPLLTRIEGALAELPDLAR